MYFNTPNKNPKKAASQISINSEPSFELDSRLKLPAISSPKFRGGNGKSQNTMGPPSLPILDQSQSYSMMPNGRFDGGGSLTTRRNPTIHSFHDFPDSQIKRSGLSQLLTSHDMNFNSKSSPYMLPMANMPPMPQLVMLKGRRDEKLYKKIKGQNDLIEQLSNRIQEQERNKYQEQQAILDEKLRMMQMELQVKATRDHKKKKKSHKKKNNDVMSLMMAKLLMGDDEKGSKNLMTLLSQQKSDSSSNSTPSPGRSGSIDQLNQLLLEREMIAQQQAILQNSQGMTPYPGQNFQQFPPQYPGPQNPYALINNPHMMGRYPPQMNRGQLPPLGNPYMRRGPYGAFPPNGRYPMGQFGRGPYNPYMNPYYQYQQGQQQLQPQKPPDKKKDEEEEEEEEEEKKPKRRMTIRRVTIKPDKVPKIDTKKYIQLEIV